MVAINLSCEPAAQQFNMLRGCSGEQDSEIASPTKLCLRTVATDLATFKRIWKYP